MSDRGFQPAVWSSSWCFMPLTRKKADAARQPLYRLPGNLEENASDRDLEMAEAYWKKGVTASWDELLKAVKKNDIAFLPWLCDPRMLVLDCDVKWVESSIDVLSGMKTVRIVAKPGEAGLVTMERGIDQLAAVVRGLGHEPAEIATRVVQTPSGGHHLYYLQNEQCILDTTTHHREEWRVDVICGENTWVACPPTRGYDIIRDVEPAIMPRWLAEWLREIRVHKKSLGGVRGDQLRELAKRGFTATKNGSADGGGRMPEEGWLAAWVKSELALVRLGAECGGWNQAVYQAACNLVEYDMSRPPGEARWGLRAICTAILEAAPPWDARGKKKVLDTIRSAAEKKGCHWNGSER